MDIRTYLAVRKRETVIILKFLFLILGFRLSVLDRLRLLHSITTGQNFKSSVPFTAQGSDTHFQSQAPL